MSAIDWISLVENIYRVEEPSHDRWLTDLAEAFGPAMRAHYHVGPSIFYLRANDLKIFAPPAGIPEALARCQRLAEAEPRLILRSYQGPPAGTMSMANRGRESLDRSVAFQREIAPIGCHDAFGVLARDGGDWGVCICSWQAKARKIGVREAKPWGALAGHLHAAMRLRFRLHGEPSLDACGNMRAVHIITGADAILSPTGKLEHAEPNAEAYATDLRDAARRIDRARARQRREDPDAALEAWRAMVAGEWSLVEAFESDGRRLMIARRNRPGTVGAPMLSEREGQVLGFRARAHSIKLIAYEMGLSEATVSRMLKTGLEKLGISSPAELTRFASRTEENA